MKTYKCQQFILKNSDKSLKWMYKEVRKWNEWDENDFYDYVYTIYGYTGTGIDRYSNIYLNNK